MMLKAINLLTIFDVNVKIHVKNSQHYDFILGVSNMIKRDFYINKLINSKGNGKVKVITGLRRCGKSYLLLRISFTLLQISSSIFISNASVNVNSDKLS